MTQSITIEVQDTLLTAQIQGRIDGQTAPELQSQLLSHLGSVSSAILDVAQVPYMSSAGFRLLLLVYRTVANRGGNVALVGLSEEIRDTMELTGFLNFFRLCDTLEAAIQQVRYDSRDHAPTS